MLLDEALEGFLGSVDRALKETLKDCYVEKYEEEILASNRVNLRMRIRFHSGKLLEINDALTIQGKKMIHLGYRYHYSRQRQQPCLPI